MMKIMSPKILDSKKLEKIPADLGYYFIKCCICGRVYECNPYIELVESENKNET